jgi:deoxycytidylate deaminase
MASPITSSETRKERHRRLEEPPTIRETCSKVKHLDECIELAESSISKRKVGAILLKRGKIVAAATNLETKSHPEQARYAQKAGKPLNIYLHAEIRALIKCDCADTILVARVDKKGNVKMAKPCPICQLAIRESKVNNVFYTTNNGSVEQLELD